MKSFSPEQELTSHRSEERLPEVEEALYESLVPQIKNRAIKIEDFTDHYGADAVRKDQKDLADLEAKFSNEKSTRFGELFEAIVAEQIEESDLMGPDATVIVPSRFDDVKNGVDSIVEFEEEGKTSHLALAIDVTKSAEGMAKKFERIRTAIQRGELSRVKYFRSQSETPGKETFRGELRNIPRVVVGADHATVENISDLILRYTRMKKTITENRRTKDQSKLAEDLVKNFGVVRNQLATHPLQRMVLIEIKEQLEAFRSYAEREKKTFVAEHYSKLLVVVDDIIDEKKEAGIDMNAPELADDEIFRMIREQANSF